MIARLKPLLLLIFWLGSSLAHAGSYQYFRIGNKNNVEIAPVGGIAMMGGGKDLDEAFRWLCQKSRGGDFLILRASGTDAYNSYVSGLGRLNSVATLIIPDQQAARDPAAARIIRHATAVFIAGGDQARYIRALKGTPVQDAMDANIGAGKPLGGTSAGLAILGGFIYGALADSPEGSDLTSSDVLSNPYFERVTLVRKYLSIPHLGNVLTDSHFAKRDRMGRGLGFLARVMQDKWSNSPKEIAIDERSAFLIEANGSGTVVGSGHGAYFIRPTEKPTICEKGKPLTFERIGVYRVPAGGHFDLKSWSGNGGTAYFLSVESGKLASTQPDQALY